MLAALPEESRPFAAAGADRLVELEQELAAVRATLAQAGPPGVKTLVRQLARAIGQKMKKTICRS